jgi:dipeptidyl aminopeptidase/acylaminoacyl peptidase
MPWDGCELWVTDVSRDGSLQNPRLVIGNRTESVFQPEWSPAGVLHFVVESSGWWNLYCWDGEIIKALYPMQAEFGQWVFGMSTTALPPTRMLCCTGWYGYLAWLDTAAGQLTTIDSGYTDISDIRVGAGYAVFVGGAPERPFTVVRMDLASDSMQPIRQAFEVTIDPGYFSVPQPITYPTDAGAQAHGIYYPPVNRDFNAPAGTRPPLVVISHGGPTSATGTALRYGIQYWTSRGFAVLDVIRWFHRLAATTARG